MVTIMTTPITNSGLYRLLAWLSPAFPVGGFSYSHGLEAAVEAGVVTDRDGLLHYVAAAVEQGSGRSDAIFVAAAWHAVSAGDGDAFGIAAELAAALRGTSELALESAAQGQAFLATVRAAWPALDFAPWRRRLAERECEAAYPVAVGLAAALADIPLESAVLGYLHAFAAGLVAAGVKLIPLGQTDGQRVIAALEPVIARATKAACAGSIDDIGAAAPAIDLWSMHHETQYTRLFRS